MNLEQFEEMLQWHDWYYEYSDDHRMWRKGNASAQSIAMAKKQLLRDGIDKDVIDELYSQYAPK